MDKDIGRIVEVRGINVKAKLFRLLPPYLINNGIVEEKDNSYYIADTSALIKLVTDKKKWSDIGVNDL